MYIYICIKVCVCVSFFSFLIFECDFLSLSSPYKGKEGETVEIFVNIQGERKKRDREKNLYAQRKKRKLTEKNKEEEDTQRDEHTVTKKEYEIKR
jgi:hypothetical protein